MFSPLDKLLVNPTRLMIVAVLTKVENCDFNYLKQNCFFTWVKTDNFDEAFTIFERMNDRCLPLTTSDKLKHYILSTMIDDKTKFKKDSPAINKLWADIEDNLRSINFNFDKFIHFLMLIEK